MDENYKKEWDRIVKNNNQISKKYFKEIEDRDDALRQLDIIVCKLYNSCISFCKTESEFLAVSELWDKYEQIKNYLD